MTHIEENSELLRNYLDVHYFDKWADLNQTPSSGLEFIVSSACNTKCSYCYIKNFGGRLDPPDTQRPEKIISNVRILLDYLWQKRLFPRDIDIFSGEFFNLPFFEDVLQPIIDFASKCNRLIHEQGFSRSPVSVCIPTNATWVTDEIRRGRVEHWINYSRDRRVYLHLSLSVDGKFSDNITRCRRDCLRYDDSYYDALFAFAEKYHYGFHPMISADNIAYWKENFLWYVSEIKKHSDRSLTDLEAARRIYLLEVRNPDWSYEETLSYREFLHFLTQWCFEAVGQDRPKYLEEFFEGTTLNALHLFGTIDRGLGCSEQNELMIRLGDLSLTICHRASYKEFLGGYLKFTGSDLFIEAVNPLVYIAADCFDAKSGPGCSDCPISTICTRYCLGCNYEVNKDFFVPVGTVCTLEKVRTYSLLEALEKIGIRSSDITKLVNADHIGLPPGSQQLRRNYIDRILYQIVEIMKNMEKNT